MSAIKLYTTIEAPINVVFDTARSIDIHMQSAKKTNEKAIAGKTSGLIGLDEWVTWRAKHLGIYQNLTVRITEFDQPNYFVDEMVSGAFKSFRHEHRFEEKANRTTLMTDVFRFESPFGHLGRLVNALFLNSYLTSFLKERNQIVKEFAEGQ